MTATTTTARIDPQTQEELMRQAGIWIEHSTLIEDDLPARPLAAVQAEKHQLDRYTQLVADRAAARDSKCLAQIEEPAQPVCWIRFCSDGSTEGPIMHSQICEARKTSGAWTPLYAGAAPAAVAGPADDLAELAMLNKLIELGAKASYANAQSNSDDGRAGAEADDRWRKLRSEMGELIRAHKAPALEAPPGVAGRTTPRNDDERAAAQFFADNPSAALLAWPLYLARDKSPTLEAPAAPACDLFDCEVRPHPLRYPLAAYHHAPGNGPLHATWQDKPHRIVYDLVAAVRHYAALAAAPQAPAVPVAVTTRAELEKLQGGAGSMATIFPADASGFPVRLYAEPAAPAVDADGARYRYLRDEHIGDDPESINLPPARKSGLDAAVDAAIAAQAAAKGEHGNG